ncbi:geranylgeranyl pyrophosphate synthetase [Uncinocarpus reesii 1704]|uniref:Geranylgeranyl pyrophosphate synthetase n=1 Tax=Uncinocarpus reesii (strain UAMH 1704) TaxID=336963 RepID=C4JNT5_UNCRE|nr:geranylgeranyl pyrophosphate synthetase [Uncinocarpus reesii 1704]EEP79559.1 geranylgeranyl pyrophosphate synthetase [Uncinocarpus reesii 1704]
MTPTKISEISRDDLNDHSLPASITDVKHLASYSWIETATPTIAVPGSPPLWTPQNAPQRLQKDSGLIYIAQNAARHPESPLEPLFRALYIAHPSFNLSSIDVVTDRNNIRKLLSFINPLYSRNHLEPFAIKIEIVKDTAIFCRVETAVQEVIGPHEFKGYGHEFEKKYTTNQVSNSTGHHRIISYRFGDMSFIIRHETDGYVDTASTEPSNAFQTEDKGLSGMLAAMSLSPPTRTATGLTIKREGQIVSIESTLEIKTRVFHKTIEMREVAPQLWISQTPKLVRAYHQGGRFQRPSVENVAVQVKKWEECNQTELAKLATLIHKMLREIKNCGGHAVVRYDAQADKLIIWKEKAAKILPDDLYSKWHDRINPEPPTGERESIDSAAKKAPLMTAIQVGDVRFNVELSRIPYLASFVKFRATTQPGITEFVHGPIPLFSEALKGIEGGYRQCFRCLPPDLSQHRTLCETYDFLGVDILNGQTIREIFNELRSCKADYEREYGRCRVIEGNKSTARDAAFKLLYLMLLGAFDGEIKNRATIFDAVLFLVSHPGTFKWKTRSIIRAAYEKRFVPSAKQKAGLDKWEKGEEDGDVTTDEENAIGFDSDSSARKPNLAAQAQDIDIIECGMEPIFQEQSLSPGRRISPNPTHNTSGRQLSKHLVHQNIAPALQHLKLRLQSSTQHLKPLQKEAMAMPEPLSSPNPIPPRTSSTGVTNGATYPPSTRTTVLKPVSEEEWIASSRKPHDSPTYNSHPHILSPKYPSVGDSSESKLCTKIVISNTDGMWCSEKEKILVGPYEYMVQQPGKDIRKQLIAAFNRWLHVPEESLAVITKVVLMLHTASLL